MRNRTTQAKLPRVKFEIDLSNENRDFSKDQVDFAFRAIEVEHPDLIAKSFGKIKDVICATPEYLKKNKIGKNIKDLSNHECILHAQEDAWNRWTFTSSKGEERIEARGQLSTNQYPMMRLLCLDSLGIVRIPLYMVAADLKNGSLIQLFEGYEISTHPLFFVYTRHEYASKKHKVTKEIILKWFKENSDFVV